MVELCLHRIVDTSKAGTRGTFVARRPYLNPPRAAQGQSLRNDVEHENEGPEWYPSSRLEIGHVDASLDTPGFTPFLFDKLFWRWLRCCCAICLPVLCCLRSVFALGGGFVLVILGLDKVSIDILVKNGKELP